MFLCNLFPRAWLRSFPIAAQAVQVPPMDINADGGDSDAEGDDYRVKLGKRVRRGRRLMTDPMTDVRIAFSVTALVPVSKSIGVLFKNSEGVLQHCSFLQHGRDDAQIYDSGSG